MNRQWKTAKPIKTKWGGVVSFRRVHAPRREAPMPATISSLHSYPVKSCAGMNHQRAAITSSGLELDRHWVIVDRHGNFLTQRTYPKMAPIQPGIDAANLTFKAPGMPAIHDPRHQT